MRQVSLEKSFGAEEGKGSLRESSSKAWSENGGKKRVGVVSCYIASTENFVIIEKKWG